MSNFVLFFTFGLLATGIAILHFGSALITLVQVVVDAGLKPLRNIAVRNIINNFFIALVVWFGFFLPPKVE